MANDNISPDLINLSPRKVSRKKIIIISVIILILIILYFVFGGKNESQVAYNTDTVKLSDLTVSISASGTLQPVVTVDVGTELSGTITEVLVDDNDEVKKGQIIAKLDTSKLLDSVNISQATLESAQANLLTAQANDREARANYKRLQQVFELSGGKVPSKSELESAEIAQERTQANVAVAKASITQALATLKSNKTNLEKAVIRSPISGIVLARKIEAGQTVAASMNAPVLFSIAEDLAQMQLLINIDEADISNLKEGLQATFSVSAFPNRSFPATISRINTGSTLTDNVVTYKTTLTVDNKNLELRPGMTATAKIITADKKQILTIPNTALRYTPPITTETEKVKSSIISSFTFRPPRAPKKVEITDKKGGGKRTLWVLENNQPKKVEVDVGISNGRLTEIVGNTLAEGTNVITGSITKP